MNGVFIELSYIATPGSFQAAMIWKRKAAKRATVRMENHTRRVRILAGLSSETYGMNVQPPPQNQIGKDYNVPHIGNETKPFI